jgi:PAS domain S-box-containing protein
VAGFALVTALALCGLSFEPGLGEVALLLLFVPLAVCAFVFGVRGGLGFAVLACALVTGWWLRHGDPDSVAWYAAHIVTYVLVGAVLGWCERSRQALMRRIALHGELSLDLIATASFDGFFTQVNPAFTRTLGYTAEELLARPLLEFVHPDDREPTLAAVAEQTEAGRAVINFQNRYQAKDGAYRWLEWSSRPDARARALIAVARDVTERKELEHERRSYQERLEQTVLERTAGLEEAQRETLRRLALAAEFRDGDTQAHNERVGRAAAQIAAALKLPLSEVSLIREAAMLHDVGKVGVSDLILIKPGKLTAEEFDQVKTHTLTGASILAGSKSEVLRVAEAIAGSHHEWWDGSGYPIGLRGEEIPLSARIVAVADVFDALTHSRPYKQAWPIEQAVAEIRSLRGRQFDPQVIDAFERLDPNELAGLEQTEPSERQGQHISVGAAA